MTTEPTRQPTLPDLELPEYHGRKATAMRTKLTGAASRITRPHSIGDRVVIVIEAKVKQAGHEDMDDGLTYTETYKVVDMFELMGDQGSRMISKLRSLYRTADDAVQGRRPIPGAENAGYTDEHGVVLTPAELAEVRGFDPIRTLIDEELTPVVVVYDNNERDLWPDDFDPGTDRPRIGHILADGDNGNVTVVKLLHHETGEELEPTDAPAPPPDDIVDAEIVDADQPCQCGRTTLTAGDESVELGRIEHHRDRCHELEPGAFENFPDDNPGPVAEPDTAPADWPADFPAPEATWEDPDPATAERLAKAEAEREDRLPTSTDFALVDVTIVELKEFTAKLTAKGDPDDLPLARRIAEAERQGRGRGLKPRAGALTHLDNLVAHLERKAGNQ